VTKLSFSEQEAVRLCRLKHDNLVRELNRKALAELIEKVQSEVAAPAQDAEDDGSDDQSRLK
jgi:hypothetical protein